MALTPNKLLSGFSTGFISSTSTHLNPTG